MTIFSFDFAIPSTNTYYRKFQNRMIISEKGRQFKTDIAFLCKNLKLKKTFGKVSIEVEMFFKDKRKRDIDNYAGKALFDAIKDVLIEDDDQIYEMTARKKIGCGYNLTTIKIKELK